MPAVYVFHGEPASLPMAWFYVGRGPAELGLMQLAFSCMWQQLPGGLSHDSSRYLLLQARPNSEFPGLMGFGLHAGTLSVFATLMALTVLPYPPMNPEMVVWTFTRRCAHIVPALQHAPVDGKNQGSTNALEHVPESIKSLRRLQCLCLCLSSRQSQGELPRKSNFIESWGVVCNTTLLFLQAGNSDPVRPGPHQSTTPRQGTCSRPRSVRCSTDVCVLCRESLE
jgi:hypothetical protein